MPEENPKVTLSFGQVVGLGLFILALIGGGVKVLYDAIDKRLDKIEGNIQKHDERLDKVQEKVTEQGVKIEHLMKMRSARPKIAMTDDDDWMGDGEGAADPDPPERLASGYGRGGARREVTSHRHLRVERHDRIIAPDTVEPEEDPGASDNEEPKEGGDGEESEGAAPPDEDEGAWSEASGYTEITVESDYSREERKQRRCERKWRRGCAVERLQGSLRTTSDTVATMQLEEKSNRLARLQNRERRA